MHKTLQNQKSRPTGTYVERGFHCSGRNHQASGSSQSAICNSFRVADNSSKIRRKSGRTGVTVWLLPPVWGWEPLCPGVRVAFQAKHSCSVQQRSATRLAVFQQRVSSFRNVEGGPCHRNSYRQSSSSSNELRPYQDARSAQWFLEA